jgi:hypothetical protein
MIYAADVTSHHNHMQAAVPAISARQIWYLRLMLGPITVTCRRQFQQSAHGRYDICGWCYVPSQSHAGGSCSNQRTADIISAADVTTHHSHKTATFSHHTTLLNIAEIQFFYYVQSYKRHNEFPTYWPEVQKKRSNDYFYYQYCPSIQQYTSHVSKVYNSAAALVEATLRRGTDNKTAQLLFDFVTKVDILD